MEGGDPGDRIREALAEMQQYLSDAIPPLLAADSIAFLLNCPPRLIATEIQGWAAAQYRSAGTVAPISDYLYHACRKIHLLGDFKLIPHVQLRAFLEALRMPLLEFCPPEDRELLGTNIDHLGATESAVAPTALLLHRQVVVDRSHAPAAHMSLAAAPPERSDRRLELVLERLESHLASSTKAGSGLTDKASQLLTQVFSIAADTSRSSAEFQELRGRLGQLGLNASMLDVFRSLGRSLPDWTAPQLVTKPGATSTLPTVCEAASAEAMHRIATLEENPAESVNRVHEMVQAAVEQFNAGALGRAATIFTLATRVVEEKKVASSTFEGIQARARGALDESRLREFVEDPNIHVLLQKVLIFFPSFAPPVLLDELQAEPVRERRRLFLGLLAALGEPARQAVLDRLDRSTRSFGDSDWQFQRNLLGLLRRIPRPADAAPDAEQDLLARLSEVGRPAGLVKEAVAALGEVKSDRALQALAQRMGQFENLILKVEEAPYRPDEMQAVLDRISQALAHSGKPLAWRAIVDHGLRRHPRLAAASSCLVHLGTQDLSKDAALVERLLVALEDELPKRVLGLVLQRKSPKAIHLITALTMTRTPVVIDALENIAERFPDEEIGHAAARMSEETDEAVEVLPTLSGDIGIFGLPALLQTLCNSDATGTLVIDGDGGRRVAEIELSHGRFSNCSSAHLAGKESLFQLFLRSVPGTFSFTPVAAGQKEGASEQPTCEVLPLILEGMRRYDELQQSSAIVPDDAVFQVTGARPSRFPGEPDGPLQRAVWKRATSGLNAIECESSLPCDAFRVRRLLVYWVETGALQLASKS